MPGVATEFETVLSYGDECPVCGREVRSTCEADGMTTMNSECVQYGADGRVRAIYHADGLEGSA